jgi:hypothetical protein
MNLLDSKHENVWMACFVNMLTCTGKPWYQCMHAYVHEYIDAYIYMYTYDYTFIYAYACVTCTR